MCRILFNIGGHNGSGGVKSTEIITMTSSGGTRSKGIDLPNEVFGHCMVTLPDGRISILGGNQNYKKTWIFDSTTNIFTDGPNMIVNHEYNACTVFKNKLYGKNTILVSGGTAGWDTMVELWDYETAGSNWIQGKYIFLI